MNLVQRMQRIHILANSGAGGGKRGKDEECGRSERRRKHRYSPFRETVPVRTLEHRCIIMVHMIRSVSYRVRCSMFESNPIDY